MMDKRKPDNIPFPREKSTTNKSTEKKEKPEKLPDRGVKRNSHKT
jgi:hypothetical protein